VSIFRRIKESVAPGVALGLCKEDVSIWQDVSVPWNGCHCLHAKQDRIVSERIKITGRNSVPAESNFPVRVVA
jgi:hypothetical protein